VAAEFGCWQPLARRLAASTAEDDSLSQGRGGGDPGPSSGDCSLSSIEDTSVAGWLYSSGHSAAVAAAAAAEADDSLSRSRGAADD
jgi:hypothetical protein